MRKVFSDALKQQLPKVFTERFPEFLPFKPKLTNEEKEKYYVLPAATNYFRRTRGTTWEIIGVRKYNKDEWTLEVFWSIYSRFPTSRLNRDTGLQDMDSLIAKPEAHTASRTVIPDNFVTDWPVWECSVNPRHPEFTQRFIAEYDLPIDPVEAAKKVAEQLKSTGDIIEQFILPLFDQVEQATRHLPRDPS